MSCIVDKIQTSRTPVYKMQAEFFAKLIRELLEVYQRNTAIELKYWFYLPEYQRFIDGAYACGFVCNNLALMKEFDLYQNRPEEYVRKAAWPKLRQYVHTLVRGEKWADGYGSPILEAAKNRALYIVADRLINDQSLKEQQLPFDLFDEQN